MTQEGQYSSYHDENGNDIHWPTPIRLPQPIADIHIVRERKGYMYELDGKLLDDGTTRPTREPRVVQLMAAFLRYGPGVLFTLSDAVHATYHAGRHSRSWSYNAYHRDGTSPEWLEEHTKKDHWVRCNTSDNFSCAARCHLQICLADATIEIEKEERGIYRFLLEQPLPKYNTKLGLYTLEEFCAKYQAKFEREGIK